MVDLFDDEDSEDIKTDEVESVTRMDLRDAGVTQAV